MESDNLRRNPNIGHFVDGTARSEEYKTLEKVVIERALVYQTYLNKVCKAHNNYSSQEIPQAKQECIDKTLNQLAPMVKNAEQHYDFIHHTKYNVIGFVDYLKMVDQQADEFKKDLENKSIRFGRNSFFEKYRSFMH